MSEQGEIIMDSTLLMSQYKHHESTQEQLTQTQSERGAERASD